MLLLGGLLLGPRATEAAVDLSGGWKLTPVGGFGDPSNGLIDFTQTGTTLTLAFPKPGLPFYSPIGSTGTIDPDTGVFTAVLTFSVLIDTCQATLDGVASADGLAFTATFASGCPAEMVFYGPVTILGERCGQGGVTCCGNLLTEVGELCDGPCCSATCDAFLAGGSPCPSDANVCTDDVCDAGGGCQHLPNTSPCGPDDSFGTNYCAPKGLCAAGTCDIVACRVPTKGSRLRTGDGQTRWTWRDKSGAVTDFGDPTLPAGGTQYRLCLSNTVTGGGGFRTAAGFVTAWRATRNGFRYRETTNLVQSVSLYSKNGRARVQAVVGGGYSPLPTSDPLRMRVLGVGAAPSCFEMTYSNPKVNEQGRYIATE